MKLNATIFVIGAALLTSACVSKSTYNAEVQKSQTYQKLNTQLQSEVSADQVQISQLQNVVEVTLMNAILFPEGGVALNSVGEATLDKLAPVLKTLTSQTIEVNGFTDNVPIGPELKSRFPTNIELSKARADDVVKYLVSKGVPANMLMAKGLGDARPLASNDTPQGRAKNRRVEMDIIDPK